ncbi:hypothetical protein D3C84_964930 [compost metagenome]
MLTAFNLLVGSLEQNAKHIIGYQLSFVVLISTTGASCQCFRGGLWPWMVRHPVIGVLTEFIKRFDGLETAFQSHLREWLALRSSLPLRLAGIHVEAADHRCCRADAIDLKRLQMA